MTAELSHLAKCEEPATFCSMIFNLNKLTKLGDAIAIASKNLETFENVLAEKFESLSDNLLWDRDTLCTAS